MKVMPIFAVSSKKVQLLYPRNLNRTGYRTDLDHIYIGCSYNIAIEHF